MWGTCTIDRCPLPRNSLMLVVRVISASQRADDQITTQWFRFFFVQKWHSASVNETSDSSKGYIRGSYRKSWACFFFVCKPWTADEGEYGGRWNQLLCYPWVSCDVNSLHHVTSITSNKMADNDISFRQHAVIEFIVKEEIPAQKFTRDFSVLMEVCACVPAVFEDGWNILKMGKRASKISVGAVALEQPQLNATRREWMRSFKMTGVWLWTQ